MHSMGKTINELHAMLKLHEQTLPKNNAPALHAIRAAELLKNKKLSQGASDSGIFTIELYIFPNKSWVYDTHCGTHIYNTTQGLRGSRKLKPRALSLYIGNGQRATVKAIGSFHLCLPSGLVIVLNNCHYAPSITRGIISVSRLYDDSYVYHFLDNTIQVSRNNMVYFSAIPKDGIFKIDLSNPNINDSSMYAICNKRVKLNLDSALLWHCHIGHISKKHIEKLQHDGLLSSTDLRAFEKYVSCMSGKMARKPYTHQVKRAKDLLGLIHTNVCGPFRIISRQGASYFFTFTDDFSCYGYIYLLKHKHEVFETFKVFQKDVENQLGKTIKTLHSDRGDAYKSQEFLKHLKEHGIIAHRTPPYTPQHNGVSERRNRTLLDMNSLINQEASGSLKDLKIIQEEDMHPSIDTSLHHKEDYLEIDEPQSDIIPIPNYKVALLDPKSDKWLNAMNVEMQSMKDNEVWDLVDLPPNGKTIGSKWLFKKNTDMDGAVHTYKARLVVKGYTQTPRIDYEETLSPIADIRATRILIAIAVFYDYKIWKMDVKTAFLNGYLFEKVYMEQHEGFFNQKYPKRVCKLKHSIYGLKQASRQWNKQFDDEIKKFGFTQNRDEPCVYLKAKGSIVTFLILYVDDILIMGNHIPMLQDVKSCLRRCFAMKDLGEAAYILGINIYRDRSRRLSKSQGASTPAELKRMQSVPYASAVGSIMYAVRCTRPDVAFAQNITSRFQQNPGDLHWTTVKNILKYLRNTKDMFLVYGGDLKRELRVSCYTDAGYLTDADDLKSQTGYVFVLNGGVVDWKSAKQSIFATSSAEAEYIAAFDAY
ncbi:retrotransposon protein, putative, ty1-copia subclass [Tanacetum coccineum]